MSSPGPVKREGNLVDPRQRSDAVIARMTYEESLDNLSCHDRGYELFDWKAHTTRSYAHKIKNRIGDRRDYEEYEHPPAFHQLFEFLVKCSVFDDGAASVPHCVPGNFPNPFANSRQYAQYDGVQEQTDATQCDETGDREYHREGTEEAEEEYA